jgi:hypothetical protein
MKTYGMFTDAGDELVHNIVESAIKLKKTFGDEDAHVWQWAYTALDKLSYGEGFEEATDTVVRESVYTALKDSIEHWYISSDEYWFYVKQGVDNHA